MRVAVVYLEKIPETLLRILGGFAHVETALFNSRKRDEDFLIRWRPDALLYQLDDLSGEASARWMLAYVGHGLNRIPIFSFSADVDPVLNSLSECLGFLAHLETPLLTSRELALHLSYGGKLAAGTVKATNPAANGFDRAFEAVTSFHSSLDRAKVVESAMLHLPRLIPADSWAIYLGTESGQDLELVAAVNMGSRPPARRIPLADEDNPLVAAAKEGKTRFLYSDDGLPVAPYSTELFLEANEALLCLPLLTEGSMFGVVEARFRDGPETLSDADTEMAERVSASLAVALNNAVNYSQAESLCQLDDLTHLYNARFFYQALETELKRARRYNLHLSVIFVDIDEFKAVNDEYGHLVGSGTIVEVGHLLHRMVRETDIVGRYGGDEFVIALPETTAEQAEMIAERIRSRIALTIFQQSRGADVRITCSLGVAAYPANASTVEDLVKAADMAMYDAKQTMKNRVVVAKPEVSILGAAWTAGTSDLG